MYLYEMNLQHLLRHLYGIRLSILRFAEYVKYSWLVAWLNIARTNREPTRGQRDNRAGINAENPRIFTPVRSRRVLLQFCEMAALSNLEAWCTNLKTAIGLVLFDTAQ